MKLTQRRLIQILHTARVGYTVHRHPESMVDSFFTVHDGRVELFSIHPETREVITKSIMGDRTGTVTEYVVSVPCIVSNYPHSPDETDYKEVFRGPLAEAIAYGCSIPMRLRVEAFLEAQYLAS